MPVDVALGVALEVLQAALDQGQDACALHVHRQRDLSPAQKAARAQFSRLMAARLVLVRHRAELKAARVLAGVNKGAACEDV